MVSDASSNKKKDNRPDSDDAVKVTKVNALKPTGSNDEIEVMKVNVPKPTKGPDPKEEAKDPKEEEEPSEDESTDGEEGFYCAIRTKECTKCEKEKQAKAKAKQERAETNQKSNRAVPTEMFPPKTAHSKTTPPVAMSNHKQTPTTDILPRSLASDDYSNAQTPPCKGLAKKQNSTSYNAAAKKGATLIGVNEHLSGTKVGGTCQYERRTVQYGKFKIKVVGAQTITKVHNIILKIAVVGIAVDPKDQSSAFTGMTTALARNY